MKNKYRYMIFAVCMLAGGFLLCYPVICNLAYRERSKVQIASYEDDMDGRSREEIDDILEQAQAYNRSLMQAQAVLTDPFLSVDGNTGVKWDSTILSVDDSGQIGYLEIPCIDVELPIFEGTGEEELEKGVGHLEGSSLPVGGSGTHTVLAGHTGLDFARLFTDLNQMQEGDVFYLHVLDCKLVYQVISIAVVLPDDTDGLTIKEGRDLCTLVTCTPYGVNTHRLLVTGERISEEVEVLSQTDQSSRIGGGFRKNGKNVLWGIVILAGVLLYFAPWIRTALFNREAEQKISAVEQIVGELPEDGVWEEEWYEQLSSYNQQLLTEGQETFYESSVLQELGQLSASWEENGFGVIEIPKMGVRLPLYLGATDAHLASGAAVVDGTSIPLGEGGVDSNAVIAGHRGYRGIPFFRDIEELTIGDDVYVTNPWGSFTYRVESIKIIDPDDLEALRIQTGKDMITLLTCHPYMSHGKQRYLVYCVRTDKEKSEAVSADTENSNSESATGNAAQIDAGAESATGYTSHSLSAKMISCERYGRIAGIGLLGICAWRCIGKRKGEERQTI